MACDVQVRLDDLADPLVLCSLTLSKGGCKLLPCAGLSPFANHPGGLLHVEISLMSKRFLAQRLFKKIFYVQTCYSQKGLQVPDVRTHDARAVPALAACLCNALIV